MKLASHPPPTTDVEATAPGSLPELVALAVERSGSPERLAERLGTSEPAVVLAWLSGRRLPQPRWLPQLAEAAGVDLVEVEALRRGPAAPPPGNGTEMAQLLAQARLSSGLSVVEAAEELGVPVRTWQAWEDASRRPQARWVPGLATLLDLDEERLGQARRARTGSHTRGAPSTWPERRGALPELLASSRRGRSHGELAQHCGLPEEVLAAVEAGRIPVPAHWLPALGEGFALPSGVLRCAWRHSEDRGGHAPDELARRIRATVGDDLPGAAARSGLSERSLRRWASTAAAPELPQLRALAAGLGGDLVWLWAAHPQRPASIDSFAQMLVELRGRRGLTARALAAQLGVNASTVSAWERGRRPRQGQLERLCTLLGVPTALADVFEGTAVGEPATTPTGRGAALDAARRRSGTSRRRLTAQLGVPLHQLRAWEQGATLPPRVLPRLAAALAVEPGQLVPLLCDLGTGLGAEITRLRLAAGMTRTELAAAVGVQPSAVTAWERSQALPEADNVARLAQVLGGDAAALAALAERTPLARPHARLGAQIAQLRQRRDLTQRRLARQIGVFWRTVGHWETGRSAPSPEMRLRLQEVLGLDATDPTRPGDPDPSPDRRPADFPVAS